MFRTVEVKKQIQEITGFYRLSDADLLQAFSRSSVGYGESNEILEMIGDSVLSCYVMQIIHERLGIYRDEDSIFYKGDGGYALRGIRNESELDRLKKMLINNDILASQIDKWDLAKHLQMSRSDELNHVRDGIKPKADLFEAILGAIAVKSKFDSTILKSVVEKMLPINEIIDQFLNSLPGPEVDFDIDNSITVLKELAEKGYCSEPVYDSSGPEYLGNYPNGDPIWICNLRVGLFSGAVKANSLKTAKKCVSYQALCRFFEVTNDIAQYSLNKDTHIIKKDNKYLIVPD